jgi:prepilin-type N-terminal cleavage/methylation domain-containing protein
MARRFRGGRAGFTLLEIAVALAVLGVGIVTCLEIFSGAIQIQSRAARQSRAVLHARTAMDALLFQQDVTDGERVLPTTADGFATRVLVRHAGPEDGLLEHDLQNDLDMALRYLEVDVSWQDGLGTKSYTLRSMRMALENE